MQEIILI